MSSPAAYIGNTITLTLPASATVASDKQVVKNKRLSIEADWTGTPTGTFSLQCSFDAGATWNTVPGASVEFTANGNAQPAGGASGAVWNFINVPGGVWRILYTAGSGTGTATLRFAWAG